jgi:predicted nucleic acid-binding protein
LSSLPVGAVVIDGSVAIAICAKEAGREPKASAELLRYSTAGYAFYAPGTIVAETLYVLCGKLQQGHLTAATHAQAVTDFQTLMTHILPPPSG